MLDGAGSLHQCRCESCLPAGIWHSPHVLPGALSTTVQQALCVFANSCADLLFASLLGTGPLLGV